VLLDDKIPSRIGTRSPAVPRRCNKELNIHWPIAGRFSGIVKSTNNAHPRDRDCAIGDYASRVGEKEGIRNSLFFIELRHVEATPFQEDVNIC
jgi:hypothetical protein